MNRISLFRRLRVVFACAALLLSTVGLLELHEAGNHHRELPEGTLLAEAAAHPAAPQHFESCEPTREHGCATCALTSQTRGARPPAGHGLDTPTTASAPPAASAAALAAAQLSFASPRGPPAA